MKKNKETAVQYLMRQLKYTYDAKKAVGGEVDVEDIEYFGQLALQKESQQLMEEWGEGYSEGVYDGEYK